jgi:hypothetical protein
MYTAVLRFSFLALDFKQLMTQIWVAGCWVQFPNGVAYVLVIYGLSCAALLRFFPLVLLICKDDYPDMGCRVLGSIPKWCSMCAC